MRKESIRWAAKWRSKSSIDGVQEHFVSDYDKGTYFFRSRSQAREFIEENYGYIKERPDLRKEPHGWKMPVPVKVKIVEMEIT